MLRACCIAGRYHGDLVAAAQGPPRLAFHYGAGVRRGMRVRRRGAQLRRPSLIVMAVAVPALVLLGVRHLDHYVERAHANKRWLLAELAAQPICTGQVMPAF